MTPLSTHDVNSFSLENLGDGVFAASPLPCCLVGSSMAFKHLATARNSALWSMTLPLSLRLAEVVHL